MKLLLHPLSQKHYDAIVKDPPQAILLVAPAGSGKETLLKSLAKDILGPHPVGRLFELLPLEEKNSIGIEAIRDLKMMLRLK
jgi:ABC-type iron transport system FetAB ATPase subunit